MAKQTRPSSSPIPIRFSERMLQDIEAVAAELELSRQDVIRLSTAAGLKALKKIGYEGITDRIAEEIDSTPPPKSSSKKGEKGA